MIVKHPAMKHIPELKALWKEAFDDPCKFIDDFFNDIFTPECCICLTDNNNVIAALHIFECGFDDKRTAYIYAVAVFKKYRGNGFGKRLMLESEIILKELGYEGLILVPASEQLYSYYEKLGYYACTRISTVHGKSSSAPIRISSADKERYGFLRRKYLPAGGIIQENRNLDFLTMQAELYEGDNFILACQIREKHLYGKELLGDTSCIPGILSALCCDSGEFMFPGNDKRFAMYKNIGNGDSPLPTYFGLAFD